MKKENIKEKNLESFEKMIEVLELKNVNLVGSDFHIALPAEMVASDKILLEVSHEYRWTEVSSSDSLIQGDLFCFVTTIVTARFKEDLREHKLIKDGIAFLGSCMFVVRYASPPNAEYGEDLLQQLTEKEASVHALPYIRSYLDSQFSLMGLHGLVFPLFKK